MSTKPFKIEIDEDMPETEAHKPIIRPFKMDTEVEPDTSVPTTANDKTTHDIQSESKIRSCLGLFSRLGGVLIAFFVAVFFMLIAHVLDTIESLTLYTGTAGYLYLLGLVFFVGVVIINIFSNIKQVIGLKDASGLKEKFKSQKVNPTKEIINLSNKLFANYKNSDDPQLKQRIEAIKDRLNTSQIYQDIYHDLDRSLLAILDKRAKKIIYSASLQASIYTAVSPIPIIDMLLIIWRSFALTKDIATLYGFRPGGLTCILLLKEGAVNVAWAGGSEIASDFASEVSGTALLSKILPSAGTGLLNGILLAKLGYGVIDACRPIKFSEKRDSLVHSLIHSLTSAFRSKEEKGREGKGSK